MSKIILALDRFHLLWLVLAAPFLLFPTPQRSLAMLVIPALFLLHWLAGKVRKPAVSTSADTAKGHPTNIIPSTPLNTAFLLLFVMVLVSLWVTYDINYSLPKISGMVLAFGIFFETVRFARKPSNWLLCLLAFLLIGLGIAIVGLFGTTWFASARIPILSPLLDRLPRLVSGLQGAESGFHPNEVAGALLWILPVMAGAGSVMMVSLYRSRNGKPLSSSSPDTDECLGMISKKTRGWLLSGSVIILLGFLFTGMVLLFTQSRGGLIALAAISLLIVFISLPSKKRWYAAGLFAVIMVVLGYFVSANWKTVQTWIMGNNLASAATFSIGSLQQRIEIWSRALMGIRDFPFTGMGMNVFRKVVPQLYPIFSFPQNFDIGHAHNELLQSALDLGIPGLIAFISLYIGAFWMLARMWIISQRPSFVIGGFTLPGLSASLFLKMAVIGLGSGLAAHFFYGLTDAIALGAKPGLLFWMLLALVTSLYALVYPGSTGSTTTSSLKVPQ